jgi:hypothetical protein
MESDLAWVTRGIWSIQPWQDEQPTPAARCAEWSK